MKAKNFTSAGALHPILFFAVMYVVVLLLSIFICSSIFYSFNSDSFPQEQENQTAAIKQSSPLKVSTAMVVR